MSAAEDHELSSTQTLGDLARQALAFTKGNTEKAVKRILRLLKNDEKLLESVIEAAVNDAVYHRVQSSIRHQRSVIERDIDRQNAAATIDRGRDKQRAELSGSIIASCLLDMPLAGGIKLRDAGHAEVMAQIERYEQLAGNMSHKARWLRLIAQSVPTWPPGKRVGSLITEKRALELFEETRLETAA